MKPKLVLLHGALGSTKQFDYLIPLLEDSFEVFVFNFEGHGGVVANHAYSIQLFTDNTLTFFEKHNLENAYIFGYSMGGYVALNFAIQNPKLVHSICTLATKFDWNAEESKKQASMLNPEVIAVKVPHFAEKLQHEHEPLNWQEVMTKTAKMMLDLGNGSCLKDSDFEKVTPMVHLAVGSKDHMVSVEETTHVFELLPHATMTVLDGIPHPIEKVSPSIIEDFIKQSFLT